MPEFRILSSASSPQSQSNEKGKLFEKLMRTVLRGYGFEIENISVNYAGMEIDIEGTDKISKIPLYAECKFYEKAVDSPKFQAFFGKYMSRWKKNRKSIGLFIAIEVRPSFWTVAIRSRKTEENWEIIENGTAKKTDIQRGI